MRSPRLKRTIDVVVSSTALILLLPLFLVISVVVALALGTPVLFRQARPGLHGKPFCLVKFRTMSDAADPSGRILPDAQRLTGVGRTLRALSLDELPELWNVLLGEMSLVGPRPLLLEYLPLYSEHEARRHEVRPGLTGWAQVNGRNAISWPDRLNMDVWYVDHWSIALDLRILCLTLLKVLRRDGITADGEATMTKFTGTST
jgi:sugar transferase EpsL